MKEPAELQDLIKAVEKKLPTKRMRHTMGVAYTAANLAMRYGCELDKAFTAGLFHDIAKCYDNEELVKKAEKYNLEITESEREAPYLLHGKVGAWQAYHKYGIEDGDVLDAIRYHTTGKPDMTLLGKIIFTADYMEPGRPMVPGLDKVRAEAFKDIDKTVYMILEHTLEYLSCKKVIDPMTEKTYEFYKPAALKDRQKEAE